MSVFLLKEVRWKFAFVSIAKGKNSNCLEYMSSCSHTFCFLGVKDLEDDKQSQNSFFSFTLDEKWYLLSQLESAASISVVIFHLLYPATHQYNS